MSYSVNLNLVKFILILFMSVFFAACSSEDDDSQISRMTPEEMSELAEQVAEEGEFILEPIEEPEYQLSKIGLPEFLKTLETNSEIQENYNACPVKIFQKYKSYDDHMSFAENYEQKCANDPATCLKKCIEERNGLICHDLAYVLESNENEISPRFGRMMYAQACATGWPLSCTNRGAGIRNAMQDDDPFFNRDEAKTNMCLNTTFEKMCDETEAWGCFMTGSSYSYGQGRKIDEVKADEYYKSACEVDPESGAC